MRIALYDYDLNHWPGQLFLKSDIMKMYAYYRKYGHEVDIIADMPDTSLYDKVIIFCDHNNFLSYRNPLHQDKDPKYIYRGYLTNNLKYISFYEDEINYIKYDAKCYKKLLTHYKRIDKVTTLSADYIDKTISKKYIRLFINKRAIPLEEIIIGEKIIIQDNYFFDCENWQNILKQLSVFSTYITFEHPINIYNQSDFDNYILLMQMGFKIKGIVLIEDVNEMKAFILNNIKKLQSLGSKMMYHFTYSRGNLYSESFYFNCIPRIFDYINFFKENKLHLTRTQPYTYINSYFILTDRLIRGLLEYMADANRTRYCFEDFFYHRNKKSQLVLDSYKSFINRHPELYAYFNIIYS